MARCAVSWRPCSPRRLPPRCRACRRRCCREPTECRRIPRRPFRQRSEHKARQSAASLCARGTQADAPPSPRADKENAHSSRRAVCARRLLQRARRRPGGGGEHEVSNQPGAKRAGRRARGRRRAGEAVLRPAADVQPVHVRDARRPAARTPAPSPAAPPRAPCPLPNMLCTSPAHPTCSVPAALISQYLFSPPCRFLA